MGSPVSADRRARRGFSRRALYRRSDGDGFLTSAGPRNTIVLHPDDAPDLLPDLEGDHTGCCGWHGQSGLNRLCLCGAAVGTEIRECYTAYALHLDPAQVHALDASIVGAPSEFGQAEQ